MIIIDYSQVILSAIIMNLKNEAKSSNPDGKGMIKHVFLSQLLSYKKMFKDKEIVIACDSSSYWRKDFFPHYKGQRKEAREKSDFDWDFIYATIGELREELKDNFPYKVIRTEKAEADDVIACLVKYLQTNELVQDGLFIDQPKSITIISADTDFNQLQKYKNVRQWSPMHKKFVKSSATLNEFMMEHIVKGDSGDAIPNILSPDNSIVDHIRQKPVRVAMLEDFYKNGIDACKTEDEKRNFIRNRTLVDFDYIPEDINKNIIEQYTTYITTGGKNKIFNYLIKNNMRHLMESIQDF